MHHHAIGRRASLEKRRWMDWSSSSLDIQLVHDLSWWFQPIPLKNMLVKLGSSSPHFGGENSQKCLKLPPPSSWCLDTKISLKLTWHLKIDPWAFLGAMVVSGRVFPEEWHTYPIRWLFVKGPRFGFFSRENHMFSQQKHRSLPAASRPGWTKSFRFRVEKFTISLGFKDGTPDLKGAGSQVAGWGGFPGALSIFFLGTLVLWIRFRCWRISPKESELTVTLNTSIFSPLGDQQKQGIQEKTNFSQSYSAFLDDNPWNCEKIPSHMLSEEKQEKNQGRRTHLSNLRFASSMLGKRQKHILLPWYNPLKNRLKKNTHPNCYYTKLFHPFSLAENNGVTWVFSPRDFAILGLPLGLEWIFLLRGMPFSSSWDQFKMEISPSLPFLVVGFLKNMRTSNCIISPKFRDEHKKSLSWHHLVSNINRHFPLNHDFPSKLNNIFINWVAIQGLSTSPNHVKRLSKSL